MAFYLYELWKNNALSIPSFIQLLLMKRGGQIIYSGPLGQQSQKLIKYFEVSMTSALQNIKNSQIL